MTETRPGWLKPLLDYAPLVAFFVAYLGYDLMVATAVLLAVTALTLVLAFALTRSVPMMPLVTAAIVGVFGGLTLWLDSEVFIKMKPTVVQALFAAVLLGGILIGRNPLKPVFGHVWRLEEAGWRSLTIRFALFFIAMALLNELVWRTQSTDLWVNFKVFGILVLTFAFSMAQIPLINRHSLPEPAQSDPEIRT